MTRVGVISDEFWAVVEQPGAAGGLLFGNGGNGGGVAGSVNRRQRRRGRVYASTEAAVERSLLGAVNAPTEALWGAR